MKIVEWQLPDTRESKEKRRGRGQTRRRKRDSQGWK